MTKLCDLAPAAPEAGDSPADTICSVAWSLRGTYLAIGTNKGETQLWDAVKATKCGPAPTTVACPVEHPSSIFLQACPFHRRRGQGSKFEV